LRHPVFPWTKLRLSARQFAKRKAMASPASGAALIFDRGEMRAAKRRVPTDHKVVGTALCAFAHPTCLQIKAVAGRDEPVHDKG
jgi:hypothetical protein